MKENATRAGQSVHVLNVGPCVIWSEAPGRGVWWAIPDSDPTCTIRIRWSHPSWVETHTEPSRVDADALVEDSGTVPLF